MNVLVIPEDFRKDQYILKPILAKMFDKLGKPNAKIEICKDPLLGGIAEALKWDRIWEILEMYRMVQVFLLIVDRDGNAGREKALAALELKSAKVVGKSACFIAENAWQEIEVWALAGVKPLPKEWKWADIRAEPNPKEVYFAKLTEQRELTDEPGEGRVTLGKEAAKNYARVRTRCPEDVQRLETRLSERLGSL